jgi:hypothetical protein
MPIGTPVSPVLAIQRYAEVDAMRRARRTMRALYEVMGIGIEKPPPV